MPIQLNTLPLLLTFSVKLIIQISGPLHPALEGGNVTLTCIIQGGYAKPRIQWFKDKMPLERETNTTLVLTQIKADDEGKYNTTLVLTQIKADDEGEYTCQAENVLDVAYDSIFVIVDSE